MAGKILLVIIIVLLGLVIVLPFVLSMTGFNVLQFGTIGGGEARNSAAVLMRSPDGGEEWENVSISGDRKTAFPTQALDLEFHPTEAETIFLGAKSAGLWKSSNGGASWQKMQDKSGVLQQKSDVYKVAISRSDPKVMYLAVYQQNRGRVLRSENGGESFKEVYFVSADRFVVSDIFVNPLNSNHILIATGLGGVLESGNGGKTWRVLKWFAGSLKKLLVNPRNPAEIFVVTSADKILKSVDGGANWTSLEQELARAKGDMFPTLQAPSPSFGLFGESGNFMKDFSADPNNFSILYLASRAGLFRSQDGGFSWERVEILISPEALPVNAVAVHPQFSNIIFAGAANQLYRSDDRGINWSVRTLPASSGIDALFVQPLNPQVMFAVLRR